MVDILDELRHFARGGAGDVSATCSHAADMIERQAAAIDIARTALLKIERQSEEMRALISRTFEQKADGNGPAGNT